MRLTVLVPPDVELLEMVRVPVAAPVTVGSKLTWSVNDCPGFSVAGNVPPEIAKAPPVSMTEFTVTAAFPDELSMRFLVDVVFSAMLPKSRLLVLGIN